MTYELFTQLHTYEPLVSTQTTLFTSLHLFVDDKAHSLVSGKKITHNKAPFTITKKSKIIHNIVSYSLKFIYYIKSNIKTVDTGEKTKFCPAEISPI